MDAMRTCRVCGSEKPLSKFGTTVSEGNGRKYHRHECRTCTYKRQEAWRMKNKEWLRIQATINMRHWREKLSPEALRKYRDAAAIKARARTARLKALVFDAYGGYRCACCSETEPMFLSVDHINNDGFTLRTTKVHGMGTALYDYIVKNNFPPTFQILCMNCNFGKAKNHGICPHQTSKA